MAKEREGEKEKKFFIGFIFHCAETKHLLTAILFLCSSVTLLQFLFSQSSLSPFNLRFCFSNLSFSSSSSQTSHLSLNLSTSSSSQTPPPSLNLSSSTPSFSSLSKNPTSIKIQETQIGNNTIKREFPTYGLAAYLFVQMGAYRGGLNAFAIVGLSSKPLHVYGKPRYECEWRSPNSPSVAAPGHRILPDWGYGRIYTVVVVNCTFPEPVGADGSGGRLLLHAWSGGRDVKDEQKEEILVLVEEPRSLNSSIFSAPPQFDYLYCGSSLYGNLSPQRMREWIAYHVKLFGEKAHFVIHDAGGIHEAVLEVLKPWMEMGYVTVHDIREQERFDGYYHNQYLVVNDCLHRYRFMAKWMFFFDIDEYIYLLPKSNIGSLIDALSDNTQFTIEQMPMSNKLCLVGDKGHTAWFCFSTRRYLRLNLPRSTSSLPKPISIKEEGTQTHVGKGIIKRAFNTYGRAAYLFIQMGAYRGGLNTFAIAGLASKPLHVYGKPIYECEWRPTNAASPNDSVTALGYHMLPDWGYGHVYTVVVVNCTFPEDVGTDGSGGQLLLHASMDGRDVKDQHTEEIVALVEEPRSLNSSIFSAPPQYDYLYCGSSLYGNLSPQRMREWIAYHVKFFGERAHFVIHDAGGVHPAVLEVLKPWMERGYVTLQDIKEQERFDGYYHNQFLVVNDCLHRYRFMARWIFFFDIDEYIYLPPKSTIGSLLATLSDYTQFTIEQMPMSNKLCLASNKGYTSRLWGLEKLVYKDVKTGIWRDRKYAIQPRNAFATGVHMSQNVVGKTTHKTEQRIMYFHYHGTIAERREPCREFVNATELTYKGIPYVLDQTLRPTAGSIKMFEIKTIGPRLQRTRQ